MTTAPADSAFAPIDTSMHVADLVTIAPARAAVFERLGIEYCCGGKVALADACADKALNLQEVVLMLEESTATPDNEPDWSTASISDLVNNIVHTHHDFLRAELPRVALLAHKVARAHGAHNPKLVDANHEVELLINELRAHLISEEDEVFPICIQIEAGDRTETEDAAKLIAELVDEHTEVANHLMRIREFLDDYVVPDGACTSYRAYLDTMERLELDIHRHVHKENHILFGKVMDLAYA